MSPNPSNAIAKDLLPAFDLSYSSLSILNFLNSVSEIAAEQQTSRTAVFDLVKRTEQLLEKYEAGLHLAAREKKRKEIFVIALTSFVNFFP